MRAAPAVGAIVHLDPAALRHRVFVRDREAEAGSLHAPFHRRLALVERLEDARPVFRVDAGTLIAAIAIDEARRLGCARLRLTAEGQVRNCLFSTAEWDARALLRGHGRVDRDDVSPARVARVERQDPEVAGLRLEGGLDRPRAETISAERSGPSRLRPMQGSFR